ETQAGRQVVRRIVDSAGRTLHFGYELRTMTRDFGAGLPVTESRLLLVGIEGPAGLAIEYVYAPDGNLSEVRRTGTGGGEKLEGYRYEDRGGLLVADPQGEARFHHFGFRISKAINLLTEDARSYQWELGWHGVPL